MFGLSRDKRSARKAMATATTYDAWYAAAAQLDSLHGKDAWREEGASAWYDAPEVRDTVRALRRHREAGAVDELVGTLEEGLSQHHHDVINPRLYGETYVGDNKELVRTFLDEVVQALTYLADGDYDRYDDPTRLELFRKASNKFGRTALMLSGGATMGIYHLGVVKALIERDLLPEVISGSSMGAIVAAAVCTRTRDEVIDILSNPERIHRTPLKRKPLGRILRDMSLFDPPDLLEHIRANIVGDLTFAEAYERSGLVLNISVSPARGRQKPRILSHLSSPDLLISYAAMASSAMPFLYEPARLMSRNGSGEESEHLSAERWVDGSLGSDLPLARVGRLYNINHTIVSQTNPYVYLFRSKSEQPSLAYLGADAVGSLLHSQAVSLLGTAREYAQGRRIEPKLDQLHALTAQPYIGDINIHPEVDLRLLRKYVSNPTADDLRRFIAGGERVTWSKIAMVRDQTLVSRTFARCIRGLEARCGGAASVQRG
jgi:TAG lipase/steryl ester hydrolase/phospholipase A2/LPA acyltransferase